MYSPDAPTPDAACSESECKYGLRDKLRDDRTLTKRRVLTDTIEYSGQDGCSCGRSDRHPLKCTLTQIVQNEVDRVSSRYLGFKFVDH